MMNIRYSRKIVSASSRSSVRLKQPNAGRRERNRWQHDRISARADGKTGRGDRTVDAIAGMGFQPGAQEVSGNSQIKGWRKEVVLRADGGQVHRSAERDQFSGGDTRQTERGDADRDGCGGRRIRNVHRLPSE